MPVAAAVLRSPYLPGEPMAWQRRAGIERRWREAGVQHVTLAAAIAALPAGDPLAAAWSREAPPDAVRRTPEAWALVWRNWLTA